MYRVNRGIRIVYLRYVVWAGLTLMLILINQADAEQPGSINDMWFRCEFSQGQMPPTDNCRMLDDQGFQIIKDTAYQIVVINSLETGCHKNRIGNCFLKTQVGLVAERSKIGKIIVSGDNLYLTWLGCMQEYSLIRHSNYREIIPDMENCWWASENKYFVARNIKKIKIISKD